MYFKIQKKQELGKKMAVDRIMNAFLFVLLAGTVLGILQPLDLILVVLIAYYVFPKIDGLEQSPF